jgi:hypothetical protein
MEWVKVSNTKAAGWGYFSIVTAWLSAINDMFQLLQKRGCQLKMTWKRPTT